MSMGVILPLGNLNSSGLTRAAPINKYTNGTGGEEVRAATVDMFFEPRIFAVKAMTCVWGDTRAVVIPLMPGAAGNGNLSR